MIDEKKNELRFRFSEDHAEDLSLDVVAALEMMQTGEKLGIRQMRDVFAAFLVDAKGQYVPEAEARRIIGAYKVKDLEHITQAFTASVQEALLPPASDGS